MPLVSFFALFFLKLAHRDNGKNSVDNSGSNGGVDWLRDAGFLEDSCRIVKNLQSRDRRSCKEIIALHCGCSHPFQLKSVQTQLGGG